MRNLLLAAAILLSVISCGPGTNVFLFWSGHGARDEVLMWGEEPMKADTFRGILFLCAAASGETGCCDQYVNQVCHYKDA